MYVSNGIPLIFILKFYKTLVYTTQINISKKPERKIIYKFNQ